MRRQAGQAGRRQSEGNERCALHLTEQASRQIEGGEERGAGTGSSEHMMSVDVKSERRLTERILPASLPACPPPVSLFAGKLVVCLLVLQACMHACIYANGTNRVRMFES
jgi:hypothetical protein